MISKIHLRPQDEENEDKQGFVAKLLPAVKTSGPIWDRKWLQHSEFENGP